ncbi:type II toxin-antitoxin system PemK/MazF family toxin [Cellulomonas sp.]|uniref:type II toxin-antitoxin system PemK/MazF family toxin n=1 Tax=Cellulomonas sp. TaxID=40001 RepID=UPI002D5C6E7B|nr:type II toxin-antitoxin system PemK/MazF family toxin [Cellulomonas sp.]HYQ73598.1 type II toxin-antitoxin system PemK/MazF family toxin [Cellulomonas sp.]
MRRGEIWTVDLDPVIGHEATKRARPAIIVSGDGRNKASERSGRGVITVVPLTSNTARVLAFQVLVPADRRNGLTSDSKAQAEQIRAVDLSRFGERLGTLAPEQVAALDEALLIHLAL